MTDATDSAAVVQRRCHLVPGLEKRRQSGQFLTVILTPELKALPTELKASDTKAYEALGTVVVFQLENHP